MTTGTVHLNGNTISQKYQERNRNCLGVKSSDGDDDDDDDDGQKGPNGLFMVLICFQIGLIMQMSWSAEQRSSGHYCYCGPWSAWIGGLFWLHLVEF